MILTKNQSATRQSLCKAWRVPYHAKQEESALLQLAARLILWQEEKRQVLRRASVSSRGTVTTAKGYTQGNPALRAPTMSRNQVYAESSLQV